MYVLERAKILPAAMSGKEYLILNYLFLFFHCSPFEKNLTRGQCEWKKSGVRLSEFLGLLKT
jgi:hypothetical protein